MIELENCCVFVLLEILKGNFYLMNFNENQPFDEISLEKNLLLAFIRLPHASHKRYSILHISEITTNRISSIPAIYEKGAITLFEIGILISVQLVRK